MNNFTFQNPTKIIFGKGSIASLAIEIPQNKRILLTFGGGSIKSNGVYQQVCDALKSHTFFEFWGIEPNPTVETLRKAIEVGKANNCDFVLAVGGGSVIDGSKLIASAINYSGDAWEIVMKRVYSSETIVPLASVLTLPATGSEMNAGAVINNSSRKEKFAFYSRYPLFSILDPQVTYSLPDYQIANGLADTFVHVVEQYLTTPDQSPLMDRWAESILQTIIEIAPKILKDKTNYDSMATFMLSATMALNGFISMGVSEDWSTHMIGHEITALTGLTHGHTLAIVLPGTMQIMRQSKGDKIVQLGRRVFGITISNKESAIDKTIEATDNFFISIGLPTKLSENGIKAEVAEEIVRRIKMRDSRFGENRDMDHIKVKEILDIRF
jgi:Uncharacterized oxidoreductases, Fe-dependent alcohol dehydrogenase family